MARLQFKFVGSDEDIFECPDTRRIFQCKDSGGNPVGRFKVASALVVGDCVCPWQHGESEREISTITDVTPA